MEENIHRVFDQLSVYFHFTKFFILVIVNMASQMEEWNDLASDYDMHP